jgi:multiple sugar transport system permease protein
MTETALAATPDKAGPDKPAASDSTGMAYLNTLPRRVVTLYLPLFVFMIVLLFPFYWMAVTTFKPNDELYNYKEHSPFLIKNPTFANIEKLLFNTNYPEWLFNTMLVAVVATALSVFASVLAAYAIQRLKFRGAQTVGLLIFLAYLVPPSILFIPLATMVYGMGLYDTSWALILTYPTFLIPFCTWLMMGYFKSIPYELEECALIDGASRLQILWRITLPLAVPGLISAGIFAFTLSWNEFIYALAFISSSEEKTVPVGVLTQLVEGDVYHWGALMAGALFGSLPVVDPLLVLCRVLRLQPHRRGEGIAALQRKPWMPGTPPGMTVRRIVSPPCPEFAHDHHLLCRPRSHGTPHGGEPREGRPHGPRHRPQSGGPRLAEGARRRVLRFGERGRDRRRDAGADGGERRPGGGRAVRSRGTRGTGA